MTDFCHCEERSDAAIFCTVISTGPRHSLRSGGSGEIFCTVISTEAQRSEVKRRNLSKDLSVTLRNVLLYSYASVDMTE